MKIGHIEITVHRHAAPSCLTLDATLPGVQGVDAGTVTRQELRDLAHYLLVEADKCD